MMPRGSWLSQWGWEQGASEPAAAYLHIPFCRQRCGYCNFSLLANRPDLLERFVTAIIRELEALESPRVVKTIFLGGGTPSILPLPLLDALCHQIRQWLLCTSTSSNLEFSLEANPLDLTDEFLHGCRQLGFNRISIGGQSFSSRKLQVLERDHSPADLESAIERAKRVFPSVSVDLIFGVPGESLATWVHDLETAIRLDPQHISTYGLTYEKGAKFWSLREKGQIIPAAEELELSMYLAAIDRLTAAGYVHYEVSNFAKPGEDCKHNRAYWQGLGWWAFGPSAARFVHQTRSVNHRSTIEYLKRIESGRNPMDECEVLTPDQLLRERFVFGMRQLEGVPWSSLAQHGPSATVLEIEEILERHVVRGWIERDGDHFRLTRSGLVLSDSLWSEYL
jgi:oxygen-independent coproporphyrinogen III oxidase